MPNSSLSDRRFDQRVALEIGPILQENFFSKKGDVFPCVKASMVNPNPPRRYNAGAWAKREGKKTPKIRCIVSYYAYLLKNAFKLVQRSNVKEGTC